jgi:uncharacterized protein YraI
MSNWLVMASITDRSVVLMVKATILTQAIKSVVYSGTDTYSTIGFVDKVFVLVIYYCLFGFEWDFDLAAKVCTEKGWHFQRLQKALVSCSEIDYENPMNLGIYRLKSA